MTTGAFFNGLLGYSLKEMEGSFRPERLQPQTLDSFVGAVAAEDDLVTQRVNLGRAPFRARFCLWIPAFAGMTRQVAVTLGV
jgi:hypothetical protein